MHRVVFSATAAATTASQVQATTQLAETVRTNAPGGALEGVRIENDTLFALNDRRETMDTEKLEASGVVLGLINRLTDSFVTTYLSVSNQQAATQPFEASLASNAVFEWTRKPGQVPPALAASAGEQEKKKRNCETTKLREA